MPHNPGCIKILTNIISRIWFKNRKYMKNKIRFQNTQNIIKTRCLAIVLLFFFCFLLFKCFISIKLQFLLFFFLHFQFCNYVYKNIVWVFGLPKSPHLFLGCAVTVWLIFGSNFFGLLIFRKIGDDDPPENKVTH